VSNIADYGTSYVPSFSLLGYGSDKQVVQGSAITLMPSGNVGIGTAAAYANLHIHNSNTVFTGAPTVLIGDGQIDAGGNYGMLQLVRANGTADSKSHISFIKNGISVFSMGYYPISGGGPFGLVAANNMNSSVGLWMTTGGSVGIGTTAPNYMLHVNGTFFSNGASRIVIMNGTDGGNAYGLYYWTTGDSNWVAYMGQSGASKSAGGGTACTGAFGFASHAIRHRVYNYTTGGFIWENSSETCLMSIRADGAGGGMIGSWGVNTLSPAYTLDVNGNTRSTEVYATNWFRVMGGGGVYWESYARGIWSADSAGASYGNVSAYGTGINTWNGYDINGRYCFMANGDTVGIHDRNYTWAIRSVNGTTYFDRPVVCNSSLSANISGTATYATYTSSNGSTTIEARLAALEAKVYSIMPVDGVMRVGGDVYMNVRGMGGGQMRVLYITAADVSAGQYYNRGGYRDI
jgi:hypothetical protein